MNLYLARDMDGMLHAFPVQPYYVNEFFAWMPDKKVPMADTFRVMPRDWGDDVLPGKCVLLEEAKPAVVLDGELKTKLAAAIDLLKRCYAVGHREAWSDGETNAECFAAVNDFLWSVNEGKVAT